MPPRSQQLVSQRKAKQVPIEVIEELARRHKSHQAALPGDLMATLFLQQRKLIEDKSQYKVAVCSRQAGKSYTASTYLLKACLETPEADCAYIALTRQSAKRIIWRALKQKVREMPAAVANLIKFNESELVVNFPNGSTINLYGANDQATIENLRGTPWVLVILDEAASYRSDLTYAMDEAIIPALITKQGTLLLIGTPSADFSSYFYKAFNDLPEFSKHHWTIHNNTAIPHAGQYIADLKRKKGWDDNNPVLLREYFGKFVRSTDNLIYSSFSPVSNIADSLPEIPMHVLREYGGWLYVLGVDIGFKDHNAISVLAFNPMVTQQVFVVKQWKQNKLNVTQLGTVLQKFCAEFSPISVVMDHGGLGVMISDEISTRFGLNIKPAKKTEKAAHQELVNAAFQERTLIVLESAEMLAKGERSPLTEELMALQWLDDSRSKEDPTQDNHMCDATLYAYRDCYAWVHERTEAPKAKAKGDDWGDDEDDYEPNDVTFG
jgi:hypothetical protein